MNNISYKIQSRLRLIVEYVLMIWPSVFLGKQLRRFYYSYGLVGCGVRLSIGDRVAITGIEGVTLGSNCSIMSGSYLYSHSGGKITIGDNISLNHNVIIGAAEGGKIQIGNDVLIGPNVVLRASPLCQDSCPVS